MLGPTAPEYRAASVMAFRLASPSLGALLYSKPSLLMRCAGSETWLNDFTFADQSGLRRVK